MSLMSQNGQNSPPKTWIIAEAGVNHNGDAEMALCMVESAAKAGADAVKFQTFKTEALVTYTAPKADYQKKTTGSDESQFEMVRKLELDWPTHHRLASRCRELGIAFLSAPFDLTSLEFLVRDMRLATLKIPSGEITNGPLLWRAAFSGRRIILSTGMADLREIKQALAVMACGYCQKPASDAAFWAAYHSPEGEQFLQENVTLLHCTTAYPTPFESVNLRAMDTLANTFSLPVGLSDHSPGITIPMAAVARGAIVVEKHFTLDRNLPGPDHLASLEPAQLEEMVAGIRSVEMALGDGCKTADSVEWKNRDVARKSLVALTPIRKGARFTEANLGSKRPGTGISPMDYWVWLGREATRDYAPDQPIGEDECSD